MKILGLDLGTNSIGWAVVDNEDTKILDTGVRIFPEGVEAKTLGLGEKEQSNNATRRDKRQMRRQFYRKRLRKIKLLELLIDQQMCPLDKEELGKWKNWDKTKKTDGRIFPNSSDFVGWLRMNPYNLREKSLDEKITLYELGRILYHLIQRRGFLSDRKSKEDSTIYTKGKPDENILPIIETKEKIKDGTLGKYLSSISLKEGVPYKAITDDSGKEIRVRGRYTVRDMYVAEFEQIWATQSAYYDLNERIVKVKKIREFKGSLNGKRNSARIAYLKEKFGSDNVEIIASGKNGFSIIATCAKISLKELLGGEINTICDENGDKILQFKSKESILFWQRPLRSQKSLIANCRFENNIPVIKSDGEYLTNHKGEIQKRSKKPCPISHPEFELFRAYQFVNNIKYGKNINLIDSQRHTVLKLINRNDANFDFKKIPQELNLSYEKFNYEDDLKVAGNPTIKKIKPLFDPYVWDKHYEEIWHCFYFYDDNEMLFDKLKKDFGLAGDISKIKNIKIKEGYSNVSLKAIRNILPFLEKGFQYDRAVILGGVKNAFGKNWEYFKESHHKIESEIIKILNADNKEGEAIEKIKDHLSNPSFTYGFSQNDPRFSNLYHHSQQVNKSEDLEDYIPELENLRNPIVQQALHETRRLVNDLIDNYRMRFDQDFHFDRINIEMGRDLRNSKAQRQEMSLRIRENENKNDEARERLAEYGLQPSRENLQKYLMFKEIEDRANGPAMCPYTGKIIKLTDLLGRDNAIQIEHIVPYSISLDDSFGNKTLCEANFNREKGEKTPFQFYKENPDPSLWGINKYKNVEDGWTEISERAFRILPYNKAKRFTSRIEFKESDFIERQLNDSRYIAKKAVELISHVCKDVRVMPGQLTAELRHLWGLNNILQPVQEIEFKDLDLDEDTNLPVYLVLDETGRIISFQRKQNKKPVTGKNEILVSGFVDKERFNSKQFSIEIDTSELPDGKYWVKLKIHDTLKIFPKYVAKPLVSDNQIILKGIVAKGIFSSETTGRIKTSYVDGRYWAKFQVLNVKFEEPEKGKQPIANRNQILLYGNVENGYFKSFVYQCQTEIADGKYWIILDYNPENIEFIRSEIPKPETAKSQLVITATIDEEGTLFADIDKEFKISTISKPGKYFAVLTIESIYPELIQIENKMPEVEQGQTVLEGNIWVDKYTGEIKFDPKKNRDDHRHHAINAITIALTEQRFLQFLSTYNARRKEKQRQKLDNTEKFPEPWPGFNQDVKEAVNSILVSHKKSNKTLTKNKKGFSVRGQLHKENVFGKRQAPQQEEAFHRRTKITDLQNNKHVGKVVDLTIQKLIEKHLAEECGIVINNPKGYTIPKDAFVKEGKWRLYLPNKNGGPVPIKKVRIKEAIGNAAQLKSNINQWVNPRNNHHVLIYKDHEGNLKEDVVQFWTVVERVMQGMEIYQLPEDGKEIVTTLEINDMFLLGINNEDYESSFHNPQFLSEHLYKVEAISSKYYELRHHLESSQSKSSMPYYYIISSLGTGVKGWQTFNPIKVNIDVLGSVRK
jgi:CRISPR-associated endonuclease Csn1